jgi:hypothetical protein
VIVEGGAGWMPLFLLVLIASPGWSGSVQPKLQPLSSYYHDFTSPQAIPFDLGWARRFPYSAKGERPLGSRSQICSKWHVICAGLRHLIGVFSRLLGAIELANRFCTNEPGPHVLRFRILLGAAF